MRFNVKSSPTGFLQGRREERRFESRLYHTGKHSLWACDSYQESLDTWDWHHAAWQALWRHSFAWLDEHTLLQKLCCWFEDAYIRVYLGRKFSCLGSLPFPRAYHRAFEKGVERKAEQQLTECTTQRPKISKNIQTYTVVGPRASGPVFSSVFPSFLPMNSMARKGMYVKCEWDQPERDSRCDGWKHKSLLESSLRSVSSCSHVDI